MINAKQGRRQQTSLTSCAFVGSTGSSDLPGFSDGEVLLPVLGFGVDVACFFGVLSADCTSSWIAGKSGSLRLGMTWLSNGRLRTLAPLIRVASSTQASSS